jgi:hypothetical protein
VFSRIFLDLIDQTAAEQQTDHLPQPVCPSPGEKVSKISYPGIEIGLLKCNGRFLANGNSQSDFMNVMRVGKI